MDGCYHCDLKSSLCTMFYSFRHTFPRNFEDQERTKKAIPIQKYIDPVPERIEDSLNEAELFEDIAASYSLTTEEVPGDGLDPVILVRPGQALATIQTLKDLGRAAGRQFPVGCQAAQGT